MWLPEQRTWMGWLSRREMARALGLLYAVGGSMALVWLVLPHEPDRGDSLAAAMAVFAVSFGTVMAMVGRTSTAALHVAIVVIQLVIAVAYVAEGAPGGDVRLFFIWATPYAALYFGRTAATAHTLWTAVVLAVSLALMPAESHRLAPGVYLMTMGTVAATAVLVSWAASKLRAAEMTQRRLARTDVLTGLPNRVALGARAAEAVHSYADNGGTLAVMVIDLDRFKLINDTYGHSFGDELLKAVAPKLRAAVRDRDLVVRLGGDEFGVLIYEPSGQMDVEAVAERVCALWREPFWVNGIAIRASASLGVVVATSSDDSAESLLRDADTAMYAAKKRSSGSWCWFDVPMRDGVAERLELEQHLSEAVSRKELHVVYQPIVDLATGQTCQAEALLRWTAERGVVPPATFIPLAEETGLIFPMGTWVLEEAVTQLAQWRTSGVVSEEFVITVNVSARQLRPEFPREVADILRAAGVPGSALGLEITETALINSPTTAVEVISKLQALQICCLLDDFGTGYASLAHLQRFSLNAVKLDRSFVADVEAGQSPIVEVVIALGSALGLAVIAEGVETREQARALVEFGCAFGQGFLFGRPMPAEQFAAHHLGARGPLWVPSAALMD